MFILRGIYHFFIDTIQTFLFAASIFLVIYVFFLRPFQIDGASMFPTFVHGEHVLTNLISLKFDDPKRGDVIVFKSPEDEKKDFIKRVIGIAGDSVSLRDGYVYLNNEKLNELYLGPEVRTRGGAFLDDGNMVTVPRGEFFVMGDNRANSSDSRAWGFIKRDAIIGKSLFVYWPVNKMRVVKNPYKK